MADQSETGGVDHPRKSFRVVGVGLAAVALLVPALILVWNLTAHAGSLRAYTVASNSMAPALSHGDMVVSEATADDGSPSLKRGELWIFRFPQSSGMKGAAIKRLMGLPGDRIEVKEGKLWVNGEAIDEPYLQKGMSYTLPEVRLGPNQVFLLGDDRDASGDCHLWGPLPLDHLMGRVKYRVWPLGRMGPLE